MPLCEALPVDARTAQWPIWSTTARLVVSDPGALSAARSIVDRELAGVDEACSRFRGDSELTRVSRAGGQPVAVSVRLAELVTVALAAAARTDGDVDPTVGAAMCGLGYDRDYAELGSTAAVVVVPAPDWRRIRLRGQVLTVPQGMVLDLGATAKAHAADRCARLVHAALGVGVLVGLGGDIATAGSDRWRVLVQDGAAEPAALITLSGRAIATSSTISRQWRQDGRLLHHIVDPRTAQPAARVWRTVSVIADRCVEANTLATAALVRGVRAPAWLRRIGAPARLVAADGTVQTVGGWR
jgi:FAD:protein FMN transferase